MFNQKLSRVHFLFALAYTIIGVLFGCIAIFQYIDRKELFLLMYSLMLLIIGVIHWSGMYFSKLGKKAGKAISIFIAIPMLIGAPVGTIIGIYIIRKALAFEVDKNTLDVSHLYKTKPSYLK